MMLRLWIVIVLLALNVVVSPTHADEDDSALKPITDLKTKLVLMDGAVSSDPSVFKAAYAFAQLLAECPQKVIDIAVPEYKRGLERRFLIYVDGNSILKGVLPHIGINAVATVLKSKKPLPAFDAIFDYRVSVEDFDATMDRIDAIELAFEYLARKKEVEEAQLDLGAAYDLERWSRGLPDHVRERLHSPRLVREAEKRVWKNMKVKVPPN